MTDDELIAKYIELNPHRPTLAEAWLKDSAISVWAIIGALPAANYDPRQVAVEYGVSPDAVEAALSYYRRHKCLIDARLAEKEIAEWPYASVSG